MSRCGTYGDHIKLQRVVEIFNAQFLINSTLGTDASSILSQSNTYSESLPLLVLGHISERYGEHYFSLEGSVSSFIENTVEAESERIFQRYECESNQDDDEPDGPHDDALFQPTDTLNECQYAKFHENHHHFRDEPNDDALDERHHDPLDKPYDDALLYKGRKCDLPKLPTELLSYTFQLTHDAEMSMLDVFKRVAKPFQDLTS